MNHATLQQQTFSDSTVSRAPTADIILAGFGLASVLNIRTGDEINPHGIPTVTDWGLAAYELGYDAPRDAELPSTFKGTALAAYWLDGCRHREEDLASGDESDESEWEDTVEEGSDRQWDSFHGRRSTLCH